MKKSIAWLLMISLIMGTTVPVFAETGEAVEVIPLHGTVKAIQVQNVNETGSNIVNDSVAVQSSRSLTTSVANVTAASLNGTEISIVGEADELPFAVQGEFSSISENGNLVVYSASDSLGNFEVAFCAVEKELDKAALYYTTYAAENDCETVLKLYLVPAEDAESDERDFVIVEMFDVAFPIISQEMIANLPANHQLNISWYAKWFEPVQKTYARIPQSRSTDDEEIYYASYDYTNVGMYFTHYMEYRIRYNINDPKLNHAVNSSATIEIKDKAIYTIPAGGNMSSETSSLFSIKNLNGIFATRPNTFFTSISMSGTATSSTSLSIGAAINWALGVFESISAGWVSVGALITDPDTYDLSWLPQTATMNIQDFEGFTNAGTTWYRSERFALENGYLMAEQDHITLEWDIEAQDTVVGSVDTSSLQFSFDIFNEMDYPQYEPHTYTYNFNVGIAP